MSPLSPVSWMTDVSYSQTQETSITLPKSSEVRNAHFYLPVVHSKEGTVTRCENGAVHAQLVTELLMPFNMTIKVYQHRNKLCHTTALGTG